MDAQHSEHLLRLLAHAATLCSTDREAALPILREAQSWLWRLSPDQPLLTAMELERKLSIPLEDWLPASVCADYSGALLAAEIPTQLCNEMLLELDITQQWEAVQARVKEVRDRCRVRTKGDDLYRRFRRFLIEHPVIVPLQATDVLVSLNLNLADFYEEIPSHLRDSGKIYCCPECGWPMSPSRQEVQCGSAWCREKQSVYYRQGEKLLNRSTSQVLEGITAGKQYRLLAPLWKFTLLPGLLELGLARQIAELGLEVILWPDVDRSDLRVVLPDGPLDIDAKVWTSPHYLAQHLEEITHDTPRWIVIPDYQKVHLGLLTDRAPNQVKVFTQSGCLKELKRYAPAF